MSAPKYEQNLISILKPTFFVDKWGDLELASDEEDDGTLSTLDADFVDIHRLSDLLSIQSIEHYLSFCGGKLDAVFQSRAKYCKGMKMERIRTIYDKTNIKIAHNTR